MKILLTGASGFIGSYFSEHYSTQYKIESFSFLKDDLETLNLQSQDIVVHLSALVHQMGGATKEEYFKVNVQNTLRLAKKAKKEGVKHFVFMSSIKVYGEESEVAYKEDTPCLPEDDYGKSKLEAEHELKKLETDEFIVSIIRTPVVYGERVKANILNLVKLVEKLPILPFGKIENRRSMVYIGNLCAIINRIIELKKSGIFLATDNKPISTSNLIMLIGRSLDKKIVLVKVPFFRSILKTLKPTLHKRLYLSLEVDNSVSKKVLSFSNIYSVEEGVKAMIKEEKLRESKR